MELIDLINDLENFRNKGFRDCNVEKIILQLKRIENDKKAKIPEYVADLIEEARTYEWDLDDLFEHINEYSGDSEISTWFYTLGNIDVLARAWLDGYEVEKEKRYIIKVKGVFSNSNCLNYHKGYGFWKFVDDFETENHRIEHTKEELIEGGFEWVFDCPGIEIEEVEE